MTLIKSAEHSQIGPPPAELLQAIGRLGGEAILVTGYLGGATATQVRVQDAWFLFPVMLGVMSWLGLYLRDARVRALMPFRTGYP